MNSGLPMKFLFASVCCVIDQNGEIIVDPDAKQLKVRFLLILLTLIKYLINQDNKAEFTLTMEGKGDIISSHVNGIYTQKDFEAVVEKSQAAARQILKFYKEIVRKYSDRIAL